MMGDMRIIITFLLALTAGFAQAQDRVEVDVELFLAVDISRSMQAFELEIQRRGYAEALASDDIWAAIQRGALQRIAVTYVEWAGAGSRREIVPWTLIDTRDDLQRIAKTIAESPVQAMRRTSISSVLGRAAFSIEANSYEGLRRVIDISGDGPNNEGLPVTEARDRATAVGITINGLPLMTYDPYGEYSRWGIPDLDAYYRNCVIGGIGAFLIPVTSWEEFPAAVRRKLVLEIAGVEPERIWRAQSQTYDCLIGERLWERNREFLFVLP